MIFQSTLPAWGATYKPLPILLLYLFQSTLPAWGATTDEERFDIIRLFQSTLPAWGATLLVNPCFAEVEISIHAPRMGSDVAWLKLLTVLQYFNPRSPHGERPKQGDAIRNIYDFNPRSPHGERPQLTELENTYKTFQSTLPAWGATDGGASCVSLHPISIHAPRMGSDRNTA